MSLAALRQQRDALDVSADVLVIGGGPAGEWAAVAAAEADARVVLVDKGYLGTSGDPTFRIRVAD